MRIITKSPVFALAIFLNSVGFSTQPGIPLTRRPIRHELFRGLPVDPIGTSPYPLYPSEVLRSFRRIINRQPVPCDANTILVTRGSLVIGWLDEGMVAPLYTTSGAEGGYSQIFGNIVIFDEEISRIMGVRRPLPLTSNLEQPHTQPNQPRHTIRRHNSLRVNIRSRNSPRHSSSSSSSSSSSEFESDHNTLEFNMPRKK
ncbi:uncharacterized protein LOC117172127 [Belonocnema kinseyi]|uniref:uncharacterized protein LOC117172127 n=1 Tax=Belonocnema kinseyi TaxID=2817044 RepID=UPI00143D1A8E|nr:uncharacterized protein LOC117172127 [Belonocnema kinseyi]